MPPESSAVAERLTAQLLTGTLGRDPVVVVKRLLAMQGQDPRGVRLAIRARTTGLSVGDVDRRLTDERSLLITWLNRGTLHLVRSEDYPWLHALTTPPQFTGNARRLAQNGLTPSAAERGVAVIERSLADEGPLTRPALRDRVARAGVRTEGQALVHLLMLASLRGLAVRGPMVGRQHAYVLVRDWLGEAKPVARDSALAELARRYLAGHGPADARDLAKWAGLPLRDARTGLQAIAREIDQRPDGLVDLAGRTGGGGGVGGVGGVGGTESPPRLLGSFDPLIVGWGSRAPITGAHDSAIIAGGVFRPIALVGRRAAGTWRLEAGRVVLEPFGRLAPTDRVALEADGRDVVRFLGLET